MQGWSVTLTGRIREGADPETAWAGVQAELDCEDARFEKSVRQRLPVSFRAADEATAWRQVQALSDCGVEVKLLADDGLRAWVRLDERTCGPVSLAYVRRERDKRRWEDATLVCMEGESEWRRLDETLRRVEAMAAAAEQATAAPVADTPRITPELDEELPLEDASPGLHAGFWMRVGAYLLDFLILMAVMFVVGLLVGMLKLLGGHAYHDTEATHLGWNGFGIVVTWLYYALFESSSLQATPGKKICGLKVVNMHGGRIGLGRASARHFSKILSGIVLCIGYMMVGWTERKQGLHDFIAGCCVVRRRELDFLQGRNQPQDAADENVDSAEMTA